MTALELVKGGSSFRRHRRASATLFAISLIRAAIKRSELGLAVGIMAILVVLILPLPTWLLDVCLAFSLSLSILILMTAVFVKKPLEFSSSSRPCCSSPR